MEFKYQHRGTGYLDLLDRFHKFLSPRTYMEIGTLSGDSLKFARCPTICVDPEFRLKVDPIGDRETTMYFKQPSDRFFQAFSPKALLGCEVELAFLDGLHEAETLLRDFLNTERNCRRNSIICMHDCIPMNEEMVVRRNPGGLWTGDVWKIVPILKTFRPDLDVFCFDAGPTGLVCCTSLDPESRVLEDRWTEIWRAWRHVTLQEYGFERMIEDAALIWTEHVKTAEEMRRYFWL